MKRLILAGLFAGFAALGCGGNYSNEDIDFQLALPEREDVVVRLPAQMLENNESAEQYRNTRKTVKDLNAMADAFLSLIDNVRAYPPSERNQGHRVWGPFPNEKFPLWLVRMVMDRVGDPGQPTRFEYRIEVRPRDNASAAWLAIFTGHFSPRGGARRGEGAFRFTAAAARAALYPLEGLIGLDRLEIQYSNFAYPLRLRIDVTNFPGLEQAAYSYTEESDGSGTMMFAFATPGGAPWVTAIEIVSRWKGSGAGRADVKALSGTAQGAKEIQCWGIDLRSTFRHRDWFPLQDEGKESDCVFGPLQ